MSSGEQKKSDVVDSPVEGSPCLNEHPLMGPLHEPKLEDEPTVVEEQPQGCKMPTSAEMYVYFVALICGISMMMPVNAVFSAPGYILFYYQYAMRDPYAVPRHTNFWVNVMSYYNLINIVTSLVMEPLTLTKGFRRLPMLVRLLGGLTILIVELIIIMVVPAVGTSEGGAVATICIIGFVGGLGKSIFESTLYGMFGAFPPSYLSTVMGGAGISGALTSLLQVIVRASLPSDFDGVRQQSYIYYGLAIGIQFTTFTCLILMRFNPVAREHFGDLGGVKSKIDAGEDTMTNASTEKSEGRAAVSAEEAVARESNETEPAEQEHTGPTSNEVILRTSIFPVLRLVLPMFIACGFNFLITLTLFPTIVIFADVADYWFATICIFIFNICDVIGRFAPSFKITWPKTYGQRWIILGASLARCLFIPLIMVYSYHYINGHAFGYVMMVLFGLSNGYIGSMSMVLGPLSRGINNDGKRFIAGTLMGIGILVGCAIGTALSIGIQSARNF